MNATTWTTSPAALVGPGGFAMRACTDLDLRAVIGVSPAPRGAQVRGTGAPAGGTAARLRSAFQARPEVQVSAWNTVAANPVAHNYIDGTTLGFHPSGRPLS
jgi:hypothetical protein